MYMYIAYMHSVYVLQLECAYKCSYSRHSYGHSLSMKDISMLWITNLKLKEKSRYKSFKQRVKLTMM